MNDRLRFILMVALFAVCWFLPVDRIVPAGAAHASLSLVRWYAREHVILCLVPALFIAGAIGVFVRKGAVIKYLGARARAVVAYPVAAIAGSVLAVCSCTVLPLFAGIYQRGAGLGPASAFLYAGPAVNVMAIILTARILGAELGLARAGGAVLFSAVIGLAMHACFRREEAARQKNGLAEISDPQPPRTSGQDGLFFAVMIALLIFANWGRPGDDDTGFFALVFSIKWILTLAFAIVLAIIIIRWFKRVELAEWGRSTWGFATQILPLLLAGVLAAGLLLGEPESAAGGLIPSQWIERLVGGNSVQANFFASLVGALMYFATLTEVPIVQGLLRAGMGDGPALALLLAGPALSLPNLLVIRSVIGTRKTGVYLLLVVLLSTVMGLLYGAIR